MIKNELPTDDHLSYVFQVLFQLYQHQSELPADVSQLEKLFQLNEIQCRFISYQCEKHGMIKGSRIIYDEYNWKQAFQLILKQRDKRLQHKENKLIEMLTWIQEQECLRKHLYKHFQSTYSKPIDQCCSNCGFSWSDWSPSNTNIEVLETKNWKHKLKEILLIGEASETE